MSGEVAVALLTPRGVLRGIRHAPAPDAGWSAVVLQGYFSSTHVGPARLHVQLARMLAARGDVERVLLLSPSCGAPTSPDGPFTRADRAEPGAGGPRARAGRAGRRAGAAGVATR